MSLKVFHVVFVTVTILLALLIGFWAFRAGRAGEGEMYYLMAVGSVLGACCLAAYGAWFLRKTEGMSLL